MSRAAEVDLVEGIAAKCPYCFENLKPLELLMHMSHKHFDLQRTLIVTEGWPLFFPIDIPKLQHGQTHVVAVMAYSGALAKTVEARTSRRALPVLVMLFVGPRPKHTEEEQVYMLFLVTPHCTDELYAVVTLSDQSLTRERDGIRCLRNMHSSPLGCNERIHCGLDYIMYLEEDLQTLCRSKSDFKVFLKISLHGDPTRLIGFS